MFKGNFSMENCRNETKEEIESLQLDVPRSSEYIFEISDDILSQFQMLESDEQAFAFLSSDKSRYIIAGLIHFKEKLIEQNDFTLNCMKSNNIIQMVFDLLLTKNDTTICIESMKLLENYPFEDNFSQSDSMIFSLTDRFIQLLTLSLENITFSVLDFLLFFGEVDFQILEPIANSILPFLFKNEQEFISCSKVEYASSIFALIKMTFSKCDLSKIYFQIFKLIKFLLSITDFYIQQDIYIFLEKYSSKLPPEFYTELFPVFNGIFEGNQAQDIELLIQFLNENDNVSRLYFEVCPKITFLMINLIKSDDESYIPFKYRFFRFFHQITKDSTRLLSSKEEPFPELYSLMLYFFKNGQFREKLEIINLFTCMIINEDAALHLINSDILFELDDHVECEEFQFVGGLLKSLENVLKIPEMINKSENKYYEQKKEDVSIDHFELFLSILERYHIMKDSEDEFQQKKENGNSHEEENGNFHEEENGNSHKEQNGESSEEKQLANVIAQINKFPGFAQNMRDLCFGIYSGDENEIWGPYLEIMKDSKDKSNKASE